MTNYKPAQVFAPGEFIREELEARGWTQADLAGIIGQPPPVVSNIINGARVLSPDVANLLAAAFGTSAEYWLRHENAYRLSLLETPPENVEHWARLYTVAPIREMEKREWIRKAHSARELEDELKRFWGVDSLERLEPTVRVAARASGAPTALASPQYAWCRQAIRLTSALQVAPYRRTSINDLVPRLRTLMCEPEEARNVPRVLAEMGVRFVLLEPLKGSHIDGAALWLPDDSPVVAVSTRFDRIDSFWFTLCHELAHLEAEDQRGTFQNGTLDVDLIGKVPQSLDDVERRADRRASDMLIPQEELDSFIARKQPYFYKDYIRGFARRMGVHPGIVVGQLQFRGVIGWYANREMLVSIRKIVASTAVADGWGHTVADL